MIVIPDLVKAEFINRPNRFIAFVRVNQREIRCHVPNPGRMWELLHEGATCYIALSTNPKRKTSATLCAIEIAGEIVQLDSNLVAKLIPELVRRQVLPFKGYEILRNEIPYPNHRIDYLFRRGMEEFLVEVKSTTLVRNSTACFPDAVSERASSHLKFLIEHSANNRVMVIFVVYRNAETFTSCRDIDPKFSKLLKEFARVGEVKALLMETVLVQQGNNFQIQVKFKKELPFLL